MRNRIWISASCMLGLGARSQHHDLLRHRDLANAGIQWRAPGIQEEAIESTATDTEPQQDVANEALERGKGYAGYYSASKGTKSSKSSKASCGTKGSKSTKGCENDDLKHPTRPPPSHPPPSHLPPPPPTHPPTPRPPPQCGHPGLGQCQAQAQCKCKCVPNNPLETKPTY